MFVGVLLVASLVASFMHCNTNKLKKANSIQDSATTTAFRILLQQLQQLQLQQQYLGVGYNNCESNNVAIATTTTSTKVNSCCCSQDSVSSLCNSIKAAASISACTRLVATKYNTGDQANTASNLKYFLHLNVMFNHVSYKKRRTFSSLESLYSIFRRVHRMKKIMVDFANFIALRGSSSACTERDYLWKCAIVS